MCSYCGRLVVRLPVANSTKTKTVNVKGWDYHPWYIPSERILEGKRVRGNATVHPYHKKKRVTRNPVEGYDEDEYRKNREEEKKDSFFSLDSE